jgi:hypothetical protein
VVASVVTSTAGASIGTTEEPPPPVVSNTEE